MKITLDLPEKVERLQLTISFPPSDGLVFNTSKNVAPEDGQEIAYNLLGLLGGEWSVRSKDKLPEYDAAIVRRAGDV